MDTNIRLLYQYVESIIYNPINDHKDEYATYLESMSPVAPDTFQNKLSENLNHIGWIKNFSRSWVRCRCL